MRAASAGGHSCAPPGLPIRAVVATAAIPVKRCDDEDDNQDDCGGASDTQLQARFDNPKHQLAVPKPRLVSPEYITVPHRLPTQTQVLEIRSFLRRKRAECKNK